VDLDRYLADPTALIADHFVLETGETYGACIQPWQRELFEAVFATLPDHRPLHRLIYDERRRGESKTEDLAACAVADLLTGPARHRSYAVAADQDQAGLILDSVRGFQARSAVLAGLEVGKNVVRNPATDAELRVMSSDDRTSYGIRPRKVFFDELSLQNDRRLWIAMWSAVGKSPRSQMVAVSMAGFDFTSVGWEVRGLAAKSENYYFHTREGSELAPWLSQEVVEEQRESLHPADFARFWECRWTEAAGTWISVEQYDHAETGKEPSAGDPRFTYYGAVDLGLVHDATAIAVSHLDGDRVVLDHLATLQGSRSDPVELAVVEDVVLELSQRFHIARWIFEAPQAVGSVQRLQQRLGSHRVVSRYPTMDTQAKLFGNLYQLFANRRLVLFPHEQLRREALNLVTRVVGGRLKVVDSSAIHQDHVIALGIAAEQCTSRKTTPTVAPPEMLRRSTWLSEGQDADSLAVAGRQPSNQATRFAVDDDAPLPTVPAGTTCEKCGGTNWKADGSQRCVTCDAPAPGSGRKPGEIIAMPVLLSKGTASW
jgi:hypothetical protein